MTHRRLRRAAALIGLLLVAACAAPTPEELLTQARAAHAAGELRTAEIHLKNLLLERPEHRESRELLGQVSLGLGAYAAAEAELMRALALGADRAELELPLLHALMGQRKFSAVVERMAAATPRDQDERIALLAIAGAAQSELGNVEAAERAYREALALQPGSVPVRIGLAQLLIGVGRTTEADALVSALLTEDPELAAAALLRGQLAFGAARYEEAEAIYERLATGSNAAIGAAERFAARARLVEIALAREDLTRATEHAEALFALNPQHPTADFLMARVEVERGELDRAEQRLDRVIVAAPDYWPAYRLLGSVKASRGQFGQAEMNLLTALNNNPTDNATRLALAEFYLRQGDIGAARNLLTDAAAGAPNSGLGQALVARASLEAGELDLADAYFERSEQLPARNLRELLAMASVYAASGQFERALRVLETAPTEDARSESAVDFLLTLMQLRQGEFRAAAATAERLALAQSDAPWPVNLQGIVALEARDFAGAEAHFAGALAKDPAYVPAHLNLARVHLLQGDDAGAVSRLREVVALDPDNLTAIFGLARLALRRGAYDEAGIWAQRIEAPAARAQLEGEIAFAERVFGAAAAHFARAFELRPSLEAAAFHFRAAQSAGQGDADALLRRWLGDNPRDAAGHFLLGNIALGQGNLDEARRAYEAVVGIAPTHAIALNNLAYLYAEAGDARAQETARRAHAAAPANPAIADTLGWLEVEAGNAAVGLPLLEQARAGLPDNSEVHYHWAVALAETGNPVGAAAALEELLRNAGNFPSRQAAEARLAALRGP